MPGKKLPSVYDLFKGRFRFTDEPLWFRIVICFGTLLCYIALIWALQKWAIPAIVIPNWLSPKLILLFRFLRGQSP
jgi:hypothetical protein